MSLRPNDTDLVATEAEEDALCSNVGSVSWHAMSRNRKGDNAKGRWTLSENLFVLSRAMEHVRRDEDGSPTRFLCNIVAINGTNTAKKRHRQHAKDNAET